MRRVAFALATVLFAASAFAQSEAEILSFAEDGQKKMAAGEMSPLTYYRELHRRIAVTPTSAYPFKAENLRIIGQRIDIFEAAEAGKITMEKAHRIVAEQQAEWEASSQDQERASEQARTRAMAEERQRQQQAAAQEEAQRRALALQLLQGMQANQPRPYQLQPYVMPVPAARPPVSCQTYRVGNQLQTDCR